MSKSSGSTKELFSAELAEYRSIVELHKDILKTDSVLEAQFTFWMESARYYIVQIDVWAINHDTQRYEDAVQCARENLDHLADFVIPLMKAVNGKDTE